MRAPLWDFAYFIHLITLAYTLLPLYGIALCHSTVQIIEPFYLAVFNHLMQGSLAKSVSNGFDFDLLDTIFIFHSLQFAMDSCAVCHRSTTQSYPLEYQRFTAQGSFNGRITVRQFGDRQRMVEGALVCKLCALSFTLEDGKTLRIVGGCLASDFMEVSFCTWICNRTWGHTVLARYFTSIMVTIYWPVGRTCTGTHSPAAYYHMHWGTTGSGLQKIVSLLLGVTQNVSLA